MIFLDKLVEKLEDMIDLRIAEKAWRDYVASGYESQPAEEFWKELGLNV